MQTNAALREATEALIAAQPQPSFDQLIDWLVKHGTGLELNWHRGDGNWEVRWWVSNRHRRRALADNNEQFRARGDTPGEAIDNLLAQVIERLTFLIERRDEP